MCQYTNGKTAKYLVDRVVLWKMYSRLSCTGRFHGNRSREGTETIALDDF